MDPLDLRRHSTYTLGAQSPRVRSPSNGSVVTSWILPAVVVFLLLLTTCEAAAESSSRGTPERPASLVDTLFPTTKKMVDAEDVPFASEQQRPPEAGSSAMPRERRRHLVSHDGARHHVSADGDGYVLATINATTPLSLVQAFVGHSDVHIISSRGSTPAGGDVVPRFGHLRTLLVYAHPSAPWLRDHVLLRRRPSPFVSVRSVPHPHLAHLDPALHPHDAIEAAKLSSSWSCEHVAAEAEGRETPRQTGVDLLVALASGGEGVDSRRRLASLLDDAAASEERREPLASQCSAHVVQTRSRSAARESNSDSSSAVATVRVRVCNGRTVDLQVVRHACRDLLEALSAAPFVRWVSLRPTFHTQNHVATITMQNPKLVGGQRQALWEQGLTGAGQLVAVGDTGLDVDSCFFWDTANPVAYWPATNPAHRKVYSYVECVDEGLEPDHTDRFNAHGTHVVGSAAGNSLSAKAEYNGMAKDARVVFQDLTCTGQNGLLLPPDLMDYYQPAWDSGARVSSNSWGSDGSPHVYTTTDRLSDLFLFRHQDLLAVFAAGNSAMDGVLTPGASKNVLTVGAHYNDFTASRRESLTSYSARGPTFDHRIKPEVIGPGDSVTSALSDGNPNSFQCSTVSKTGTSMATPHVAGAAILLRQYLAEGRYPTGVADPTRRNANPSAALMKALLVQSAVPMTDAGTSPNGDQGFGRLELDKVMFTPSSSPEAAAAAVFRFSEERLTIRTGERISRCFELSTLDADAVVYPRFRATLAWIDAASALEGATKSLVNDLDLAVSAPDGTLFRGNHPDGDPSGGFDRFGNVEQVTVSDLNRLRSAAQPQDSGRRFARVWVYGYDVPDTTTSSFRTPINADDAREADGGGQLFSLVVWGPGIRLLTDSECPLQQSGTAACPNHCSGRSSSVCVNGDCVCPPEYHHIDCSECNSTCVCHGNGVCSSADLSCTCASEGHFADAQCATCAAQWFGPQCDNNCSCHSPTHGLCDASGMCVCTRPKAPHPIAPTSPLRESCFDGETCEHCCFDYGDDALCNRPSFWCENRVTRVINASTAPPTGLIQVNGYGRYDNSIQCAWEITAPGGAEDARVEITFLQFSVEEPYDYVTVYSAKESSSGAGGSRLPRVWEKVARYSGTSGLGVTITSTSPSMLLTLWTDMVGNDAGFVAEYRFLSTTHTDATTTTTTQATATTPATTAAVVTTIAPSLVPQATTTVGTPTPSSSGGNEDHSECKIDADCGPSAASRCDSARGQCDCGPLTAGWKCLQDCPAIRDAYGNRLVCASRGRCTSVAPPSTLGDLVEPSSSSSTTTRQRSADSVMAACVDCDNGYTGAGCQLDPSATSVPMLLPPSSSTGDPATDTNAAEGRVISLASTGSSSGGGVPNSFPLMEAAIRLGPLEVGPMHVLTLQLPLPTSTPSTAPDDAKGEGDDGNRVREAIRAYQMETRLRIWVLQPDSGPASREYVHPELVVWTSPGLAGSLQPAAIGMPAPALCVEASIASQTNAFWVQLVIGLRVVRSSSTAQPKMGDNDASAIDNWYLRVQPMNTRATANNITSRATNMATPLQSDCSVDPKFLASLSGESTSYFVISAAQQPISIVTQHVENRTTFRGSAAAALSNVGGILTAVSVGVVIALSVIVVLVIRHRRRHRGFAAISTVVSTRGDDDDDEVDEDMGRSRDAAHTYPVTRADDDSDLENFDHHNDAHDELREMRVLQVRKPNPKQRQQAPVDYNVAAAAAAVDASDDDDFPISTDRNGVVQLRF